MQLIPARAVVFDKDGTLIDFHATWGPTMVAMLVELSMGDASVLRTTADRLLLDISTASIAVESPIVAESTAEIAERIAGDLGREDGAQLAEEMDLLTLKFGTNSVVPVAGVADTLAAVRRMGLPLGVATNDAEATARAQLHKLGLTGFFDTVIGYDSGSGAKPDPGMLFAAGEQLGCPIEELVMVGDTPTDISAAVAAGARSVLIDPDQVYDTRADAVVGSLEEVPAVLESPPERRRHGRSTDSGTRVRS